MHQPFKSKYNSNIRLSRLLLSVILFLTVQIQISNAQPGGGGGIRILNINDYNGTPFVKGDSSLRIQHFVLSKREQREKYPIDEFKYNQYDFAGKLQTFYYIPPYIIERNKRSKIPNQRIKLLYENDTMIIDFIDVLQENGAGVSDIVTNIYFKPGYYKSYRNPRDKIDGFENNRDRKTILAALSKGINAGSDELLISHGLMKHIPDPDLENKKLERNRKICKSELVLEPFFRLCENQINVNDSLINLEVENISEPVDSISLLHYIYYFSFDSRANKNKLRELHLANERLNSFKTHKITLNGNYFSGVFKLAVPFHNRGISTSFSGFDLWVLKYSEGKLLTFDILTDVDIISEQQLVRPN